MKHIAGFDGIRGLAVTLVVATHLQLFFYLNQSGYLPRDLYFMVHGNIGVQAFFVLSGFLITHLLVTEFDRAGSISVTGFYARRALRILPVYFLPLGLLSLAALWWSVSVPDCSWPYAYGFVYNFVPRACYSNVLGHTWTLAVEEHFYILWPLVFLGLFRSRPAVLILILALGIAAAEGIINLLIQNPELLKTHFVGRWTPIQGRLIAFGCLGALLIHRGPPFWPRWFAGRYALLAGLVLYASSVFPLLPDDRLRPYGIGLILFWIFLNQSSRLTRALEFGPLVYLGRISYGVYMYQGFLLGVWAAPASTAVWPPNQYTGLIILCIVAPLSYHFLERPILKFKAGIGQPDRVRRPV